MDVAQCVTQWGSTLSLALQLKEAPLVIAFMQDRSRCESITHLDIKDSFYRIGVEYVPQLLETLIDNSSVTKLNLGGLEIKVEGFQGLARLLEVNSTLTHLNMSANQARLDGTQALAPILASTCHLTTLHLGHNNLQDDGCQVLMAALHKNTTLTQLSIDHNNLTPKSAPAIAQMLENNQTLLTFRIRNNAFGPNGILQIVKSLDKHPQIEALDLSYTKITLETPEWADMLQVMTENRTLTRVQYQEEEFNHWHAAQLLTTAHKNWSLRHIALRFSDDTPEVLDESEKVVQALRESSLQSVEWLTCQAIPPAFAQALVKGLQGVPDLRSLNLRFDFTLNPGYLPELFMPNLQQLKLDCFFVTPTQGILFAEKLASQTCLTELNLTNVLPSTHFTIVSQAIFLAISSNTTLKRLTMVHDSVMDVEPVVNMLQKNETLTFLELNTVRDRSAVWKTLAVNHTLTDLWIGKEEMEAEMTILEAIQANPTITSIYGVELPDTLRILTSNKRRHAKLVDLFAKKVGVRKSRM